MYSGLTTRAVENSEGPDDQAAEMLARGERGQHLAKAVDLRRWFPSPEGPEEGVVIIPEGAEGVCDN